MRGFVDRTGGEEYLTLILNGFLEPLLGEENDPD